MQNNLKPISLLAAMLLCFLAPAASAITIDTHFIGGTPPAHSAGSGDLTQIVKAAARLWEAAYSDPLVITIYYGWGDIGDAGTHTLQYSDDQGREISGAILFDNSDSVSFYLDPTPESDEEYRRRKDEYQDLGGGFVNVARVFSSPAGDAAGHLDLLSVALHEIGHAAGMSGANTRFLDQSAGGYLLIGESYPFAGTAIPLAFNNSGIVPHFDAEEVVYGSVMSGLNGDERRFPSELDILANAQVSGFKIATLNPPQASGQGFSRLREAAGEMLERRNLDSASTGRSVVQIPLRAVSSTIRGNRDAQVR